MKLTRINYKKSLFLDWFSRLVKKVWRELWNPKGIGNPVIDFWVLNMLYFGPSTSLEIESQSENELKVFFLMFEICFIIRYLEQPFGVIRKHYPHGPETDESK